ncbi:MAG: porin [Acidocella sp.]|nr:porin [Acidocella sp.]
MMKKMTRNRVSLIALAAASILVVRPGFAHATATTAQLQAEINDLQAQINALSTQQDAVTAQVTDTSIAVKKLATTTSKPPAGGWSVVDNGKLIPDFKNGKGSEFTMFGQVDLDTGLAAVQQKVPLKNLQGYQGGVYFHRIELGFKGVYDNHFPWEIQEDWTKTGAPLSGLLDVWLGYENKTPLNTETIFRVGNQHVPFGFRTPSSQTFDMETGLGDSLFYDGRELGATGQTYNKHVNLWYGLFTTNVGGSGCKAATGASTIVPGACYQPGSTTNTAYTAGQFALAFDANYNFINTPGHLLGIRDSFEYNRYNASPINTLNEPSFSAGPDLAVTGEKLINTGNLDIKSAIINSPRVDFQYNGLTASAEYYSVSTASGITYAGRNYAPGFSGWTLQAQYFLTDDVEKYSDADGNYVGVTPKHPVTDGGLGAIQVTARLDEANLSQAKYGVYGGNMTNITLGLVWVPIDPFRFDLNFVHTLPIGGAQLATTSGSPPKTTYSNAYRGHTSDAVGLRLEVQY